MVYGDRSLDAVIRNIQSKNLPTMAFEYETREMEVGAVNNGNKFVEYRGVNVKIVEVCL